MMILSIFQHFFLSLIRASSQQISLITDLQLTKEKKVHLRERWHSFHFASDVENIERFSLLSYLKQKSDILLYVLY